MKAILLTTRLKYFYLYYKGIKTIEIRKSAPKDFVGNVYEFIRKTNFEKDLLEIPENEREFFRKFKGKVGSKFTINKVEKIKFTENKWYGTKETPALQVLDKSCLSYKEITTYLKTKDGNGYAWHIDNLEIYDKPRELCEFYQSCLIKIDDKDNKHFRAYYKAKKAPKSWCYVEAFK